MATPWQRPAPETAPDGGVRLRAFRSQWTREMAFIELSRGKGWFTYLEPSTPAGSRLRLEGRELLNFTSNDYLALSGHPAVVEGAARAGRRYGASATASPNVSGLTPLHEELEARLARWTGQEDAMLFPSGYQGNLTVIATLMRGGGTVFVDRKDHASILDGAAFSGAKLRPFQHNDLRRLERQLRRSEAGPRLVAVESIYSMDGDRADLEGICALAERWDALVLVDEAHSFGCTPPDGTGLVRQLGLADRVGLVYGALGKCLGSQGCFVAGPADAIDYLQNRARGYVFSTGLSPMAVGAAMAALDVIEAEPERIEHLWAMTARLHRGLRAEGFDIGGSTTPITPLRQAHPERRNPLPIVNLGLRLREMGVYTLLVTTPVVHVHDTKLRLNVRGDMTADDVDRTLDAVRTAAREVGFFD